MSKASIDIKVSGRYRLMVHKGNPDEPRVDTGFFKNIITRNGLNCMLGGGVSASQVVIKAVVGSGNSSPNIDDTSLQAFLAGTVTATSSSSAKSFSSPPYNVRHSFTFRFPMGAAAGNVSEVGLANTNSAPNASTPLFSRALVLDGTGSPTSITVLPDEFLDVIYEITIYSGDFVSGSFNQVIDGSSLSTAYSIGPSNMSVGATNIANPGWSTSNSGGFFCIRPQASASATNTSAFTTQTLGDVGSLPSGAASRVSLATAGAINTASSYVDFTYVCGLDDANINIGSISFGMGACAYKMSFTPAIPKLNTKTYSVTVRVSVANAS